MSLRRSGFDSPWHRLFHPADIAQLAERDFAMVEAAGSNPAVRSFITPFVQRPKTPGSEPGNTGSNPVRGAFHRHVAQGLERSADTREVRRFKSSRVYKPLLPIALKTMSF